MSLSLPPLPLDGWRPTRDALHGHARVLGAIRRALAPPEPHWWHISLLPRPSGLSTGALPLPRGGSIELALDMQRGALAVEASDGRSWALPLDGRAAPDGAAELLPILRAVGAEPPLDPAALGKADANPPSAFDRAAAGAWWQAARWFADVLTGLAAELPGRKSPVQLWPHHFDVALTWFSGRQVPGVDPADVESAEEQMAFGFSTGDDGVPEPYVYVTAYPWPATLAEASLPGPARWHAVGWQGAMLPYASLASAADPTALLLDVLRAAHAAGAARMA